ncbi:MAG TPA: bacillithiol biosynthesis cysteine-adding enzyme BshC [Bryobacteraceae bacterium]|jgi:bacillithiol biosynthesis cysteine-adding enzyme BshC|nr:bacillithiol biosynthesis cysteine-adding enzyme BshC [Bryobacteraceae bacterium]
MDPACLRHTEIPGTSKLFADLAYHFGDPSGDPTNHIARFYRHNPHARESYAAAAREVQYPDDRRAAMARVLEAQNPGNVLVARFTQAGTMAVVTGQQVGLFSGPAYTIYKALTATRLADDLNASGIPTVPIFWMATEDHDFAEVDHVWIFDAAHRPIQLRIEAPTAWQGKPRPAGTYPVEHPPIAELRAALAEFPYGEEVAAAVADSYQPGVTMGAGFRALLTKLLGKIGMLVVDPLDSQLRNVGAPFMAEALAAAPDLKKLLLARNKELAAAGYHAQVNVEENTSLFFLLEQGERVTLRKKDAEFAALEDRAADVSPNALLRPVWQDYLFPTVAYVGGPGELAYFAQSQVIYDRLLGRMPVVVSRASVTLLDARAAKLISRYSLTIPETLVPEEALKERIAHALIPQAVAGLFEETSTEVTRKLDRLGSGLESYDPTLAAAVGKSRAKVLYQIEKLRKKTERETLRRDARASEEARYLSSLLYPQRHMQERFYAMLPFLAQHGLDLVDRLYGSVQMDCPDHRVVTL